VITVATPTRLNCQKTIGFSHAVRPGTADTKGLVEGYRIERYRNPVNRERMPLLVAAVSSDHVFDVFIDLLKPVGEVVHVVLETSHDAVADEHDDVTRAEIDMPVAASHFCDHEDLLTNDGCTGVAVIAVGRPVEVQFDEHKLLYVYAHDLKPFRRILRSHGVRRCNELRVVAEIEHVHHSTPEYQDEFRQLCCHVGAGDMESVMTDESGWVS